MGAFYVLLSALFFVLSSVYGKIVTNTTGMSGIITSLEGFRQPYRCFIFRGADQRENNNGWHAFIGHYLFTTLMGFPDKKRARLSAAISMILCLASFEAHDI